MRVIIYSCRWCGCSYAANSPARTGCCCSAECDEEYRRANKECQEWFSEIVQAWNECRENYVPDEDECHPYQDIDRTACLPRAESKRHYLAFKARYLKWKENHCWKRSFWEWDEKSPIEPLSEGGIGETIGGIVALVVIVWLGWMGWIGIKSGWHWLFGGGREVNAEAKMMSGWQRHLERRCEAFGDGLSENEVEAKGLKSYTWEEWQKLPPAVEKTGVERIGDKAKALWRNIFSNEEKDPKKNKTGERQSAVTHKSERPQTVTPKIEELQPPTLKVEELQPAMPKVKEPLPVTPKVEEPQSTPSKVEGSNPAIPPLKSMRPASYNLTRAGNDAVKNTVGGRDGAKKPATKDSKGIVIVTQGKGTTKAAAVRSALRQAVWKTVGTWVDSKIRMDEKRVQVVDLVKTVTEADVVKFEVEDAQQQNGTFVVNVRVWVSKKQIAPKFEKVFPDVFANID